MNNRLNIVALVCLVIFWFAAKDATNSNNPSYAKYNDLQKNPLVRGK